MKLNLCSNWARLMLEIISLFFAYFLCSLIIPPPSQRLILVPIGVSVYLTGIFIAAGVFNKRP